MAPPKDRTRDRHLSRRSLVGSAAGLMVAGCSHAPRWDLHPVQVGADETIEIRLLDHPVLGTIGGMVALKPNGAHPILVSRASEDRFEALSLRCPHLGCTVRWDPEAQRLACPCHGSIFDDRGGVRKGPAQEPLTPYATRHDGSRLWIRLESQ